MRRWLGCGVVLFWGMGCVPATSQHPLAVERPTLPMATAATGGTGGASKEGEAREPDVIFVPTPHARVEAMLEMAQPKKDELLYDLGCGDGRIAVAAARDYGARAICIDIDPERVAEAKENVKKAGVEHLVEVRQADLFETDFSDADVVSLYLLPSLNLKLRPTLQAKLRSGSRVVSNSFDMGDWAPDETREVDGATVYLWRIR